jgi:hypothetical protein
MHPIVTNMAALAVATLYYVWRSHYQTRLLRERILRQRVAYMLLSMVGQGEKSDASLSLP